MLSVTCSRVLLVALSLLASATSIAQVVRLPATACAEAGAAGDGFEELALSWPSRGIGGSAGSGNAFVAVPGYASLPAYAHREYFWFVPELPAPAPMPVVVLLHGTAGSPAAARNEARIVRDLWTAAASEHGFALIAPVAGSALGSWLAPDQEGAAPSDYDVIAAALADLESRHDIERARRYLWGFSAGAHVALDLIVNPFHTGFGRRQFAAVAGNAGALAGLACAGLSAVECDAQLRAAFPRLPLQMLVGSSDPLRGHAVADAQRLLAQGWTDQRDYRLVEFTGGHWVDWSHPAAQWSWLCQFARRLDPIERFRLRPSTP
jgi:poly(3-hydroxybutyrate) depolymerase